MKNIDADQLMGKMTIEPSVEELIEEFHERARFYRKNFGALISGEIRCNAEDYSITPREDTKKDLEGEYRRL